VQRRWKFSGKEVLRTSERISKVVPRVPMLQKLYRKEDRYF